MKIIIDILTPKQCMLFSKLSDNLEKRGHQIYKTTRRYREVNQLLKLKGMDATVVGGHGGKAIFEKLRASAQRTLEMTSVFRDVKPDVSVSFSSPEMARVSYGLKTPHVCVNDSPHAEAVARLTVPLSDRLLTPWLIPGSSWTRYGISPEKIVEYRALDPWAWLRGFEPDRGVLQDLGLDDSRPILTFRPEESFAAYLLDRAHEGSSIAGVIDKLLDARDGLQIVAVPRYDEQISTLEERFKDRIIVTKSVVDAPSLLSSTTVFIGAGGTMSAEAALLGVPTVSCYPGESYLVEKFLVRRKLIVRETDPKKLVKKILNILDNATSVSEMWKEKSRKLVQEFEDPIEIITREVEKYV